MNPTIALDRGAYTYTPLERGHIRLMNLEPALDSHAPIRFSFHKDQLSDLEARYEAMSYTWGEPKLIFPLYIENGTKVFVTQNLDCALRGVRLPTSSRTLWADAICINQNDNDEKALQIPMMAHIFRGANRVLAWVGGGQDEERGMQLLNRLSRTSAQNPDTQLQNLYSHVPSLDETSLDTYLERRPIRDFLSLPWFTRLWIIQEVVFNLDVTLLCGASEITWVRLVTALRVLYDNLIQTTSFIGNEKIEALRIIGRLWKRHCMINEPQAQSSTTPSQDSILDLVERFRLYGCSDARDRIFALYNMANGLRETELPRFIYDIGSSNQQYVYMKIDYSLNIEETYQALAAACMKSGQKTTILNAVLSRQYKTGVEDWPSWVPDWRKPSTAFYLPIRKSISCVLAPPKKLIVSFKSYYNFGYKALPTITHKFPMGDTFETFATSLCEMCHTCTVSITCAILQKIMPAEEWKNDTASVFMQDVLRHRNSNTNWPPSELKAETLERVQRIRKRMQHHSFFTATAPTFDGKSSMTKECGGYGNAALQQGDQIAPFYSSRHFWEGGATGLLVRPLSSTSSVGFTSYRLIGSAYLRAPCEDGYQFPQDAMSSTEIVLHLV
jgi:hypothetical protein